MAPEMVNHMIGGGIPQGYSYGIDWWALGVLTYELLVGTPPFGLFGEDVIQNICMGIQHVDMKDVHGPARDLIIRLLNPHPAARLGAGSPSEVLSHEFLQLHDAKPAQTLMNGIISWNEFLEEGEDMLESDPFKDF
jgi:serine/threonine protein kinase